MIASVACATDSFPHRPLATSTLGVLALALTMVGCEQSSSADAGPGVDAGDTADGTAEVDDTPPVFEGR